MAISDNYSLLSSIKHKARALYITDELHKLKVICSRA